MLDRTEGGGENALGDISLNPKPCCLCPEEPIAALNPNPSCLCMRGDSQSEDATRDTRGVRPLPVPLPATLLLCCTGVCRPVENDRDVLIRGGVGVAVTAGASEASRGVRGARGVEGVWAEEEKNEGDLGSRGEGRKGARGALSEGGLRRDEARSL